MNGSAVGGRADVAHEDRRAVHDFDGDVVDLLDHVDEAVRIDVVVQIADLHVAGRDDGALGIEGFDDVGWGHVAREHPLLIEEDGDLPDFSAQRGAERNAGDGGDLLAHGEVGQVADFFRAQRLAAHGEEPDRQARHAEFVDGRGKDAGREQANDAVGQAGQLGLGRIDAVLRLEEDFDVAHAGERLRFDMFDIARFDEALLHLERDRPFHLAGAQSAVERRDENGRHLDLRENVHPHLLIGHGSEDERDHADRKDGVGIFERGAGQHRVSYHHEEHDSDLNQ